MGALAQYKTRDELYNACMEYDAGKNMTVAAFNFLWELRQFGELDEESRNSMKAYAKEHEPGLYELMLKAE